MSDINFVNVYFALCLVAWVIDVVIVILAIVIPPFRRLFMKLWCKLCIKFGFEWAAISLVELFGYKEAKEMLDKLKQMTDDSEKESED